MFYKLNWSLFYLVGLPLIFSLAIYLSNQVNESVYRLCCDDLNVILPKEGTKKTFPEAISLRLRDLALPTTLFAVCISFTIISFDTYDLWSGFYTKTFPCSVRQDWDTAFTGFSCDFYESSCPVEGPCPVIDCLGYAAPSLFENLTLDILAYAFETIVIFLAFFWVGKFWWFLQTFANLLTFKESPYLFKPIEDDKWLGLRPMGKIFNSFLTIIVLFQSYIFYHRLQMIDLFRANESILGYFKKIINHLFTFELFLDPYYYGFDGLDLGTTFLLFFMLTPVVIVLYLPLWLIYRYIKRRQEEEWLKNVKALSKARKDGKKKAAEKIEGLMLVMKDTNIWPNGDRAAQRFLLAIIVLGISSFFPQMFIYLLAGAGVTEALTRFGEKWQNNKPSIEINIGGTKTVINEGNITIIDSQVTGAVGKGASAKNVVSHHGDIVETNELDLKELVAELEKIREYMKAAASSGEHYEALTNVTKAKEAAEADNRSGALEYLKKAGTWTLEIAQKVGVSMVTDVLKGYLGMK